MMTASHFLVSVKIDKDKHPLTYDKFTKLRTALLEAVGSDSNIRVNADGQLLLRKQTRSNFTVHGLDLRDPAKLKKLTAKLHQAINAEHKSVGIVNNIITVTTYKVGYKPVAAEVQALFEEYETWRSRILHNVDKVEYELKQERAKSEAERILKEAGVHAFSYTRTWE